MTAKSNAVAGWLSLALIAGASCLPAARAAAQTCGGEYTLKAGDTLADIARTVYGNASQWSVIYYANQDRLDNNTTLLVPGVSLKIPCLGGADKAQAPAPADIAPPASARPAEAQAFQLSSILRRIEFLTAEGYAPFTGRNLSQGGMVIDLLQEAMNLIKTQAKGGFDYQISWVNDWSAHLNPLLITRALDAGVPWSKPECNRPEVLDKPAQYICQKFFFSDPLYESVTALFVRNDGSFSFDKEEQILGKKICRAKGWSTYDLDKGGRNWVKEGKITLMQPPRAEDCFRLLDEGTVDGVVIAELTGLAVAGTVGMSDRVHAASRPINIETFHVIVAKTHPSARVILYYINNALARLRETGAYDAITARHLEQFWGAAAVPAVMSAEPVTPANSRAPDGASGEKPVTPPSPAAKAGDGKKAGRP